MIALQLSPGTVQALATIAAALIAAAAGFFAIRGNKRMKAIEAEAARQTAQIAAQTQQRGQTLTDQQSSYDQLQEDVKALREELAAQKKAHTGEIADIREDLRKSQKRERAVEGYAWDLRRYIERGEGPPPPPWPQELGGVA